MDKRLDKLESKIDRLLDNSAEQGATLARHEALHERNTASLEEHVRRTDLLEVRLEQHAEAQGKRLDEALLPIKAAKFLLAMAAGVATIAGAAKLLLKLGGY